MDHIDHSEQGGYRALIFTMSFVLLFMFYICFIHPSPKLDEKVETAPAASAPAAPAPAAPATAPAGK
jgi:hypothetical protein